MPANSDAFPFNYPNPERAEFLATQALQHADSDPAAAIRLLEEAIQLDSLGALNTFHVMRAQLYSKQGQSFAADSAVLYSQAIHLAKKGRHRDARIAYLDAAALDPKFAWPLNNLAWMLSTSPRTDIRDGAAAIVHARAACELANWNCYCFLETLATAYAEAGDFDQAIGWQQASLQLAPEHHKPDGRLILRHLEMRQPYTDEGLPPAAGYSGDGPSLSRAELLHPDTITPPSLQALFESALMPTQMDDRGSLWVDDQVRVMIRPTEDRREIGLLAFLRPREDATSEAALMFANRINLCLGLLRAVLHPDGYLIFEHTIPLRPTLPKTALVAAVKTFVMALSAAVQHCDTEGVLGAGTGEE